MVVRVAVTIAPPAVRRVYWPPPLSRTILLMAMAVLSVHAECAGLSVDKPSPFSVNGSAIAPGALSSARVFDPAAAQLSSWWSYGAMSVIAPIIFGDFVSPTALSSSFGLSASAPMSWTAGTDPAVAAMFDANFQQGLLPAGGAAEAEEFDIGSGGAVAASSGGTIGWSVAAVGLNGAIPIINTVQAAGTIQAASTATGIQPICSDDRLEKHLQAGGEFWNGQATSAMPVQFPPGLFNRPVEIRNPLSDLGPRGSPSNLPMPGPAGGWCRPTPEPFSQSSPLEDRFLWIAVGVVLMGLMVFWLSRGMRMPARLFDRPSLLVTEREIWQGDPFRQR